MRSGKDYLIRGLRLIYRMFSRKKFYPPECVVNRQIANDMLYDLLSNDEACMIARVGETELNCVLNYMFIRQNKSIWKKWIEYITDDIPTPWWNEKQFHLMSIYSGIFPANQEMAERFSQRYLEDIPQTNLMISWKYPHKFLSMPNQTPQIHIEAAYPFLVERPWTRILKGKRVLVIHPFEQTIRQQYEKRALLFDNPEVLPDFELITMKAVQTIAGNKSEFLDWFGALKYMENKIDQVDFDIALIGCGAYGLPLAAYIKRKGKKAVHLGGGLQLFFGILGRRWVVDHPQLSPMEYLPHQFIDVDYSPLFNEHWCYPLKEDTPDNAQVVESACYWK